LAVAYRQQEGVHRFIRKILALPFLPAVHIAPSFAVLQGQASAEMQPLTSYVENTWVTSTVWPPTSWSVYGQCVRTNNDVEGWHRRLNDRAGKGNLNLYVLVDLLHSESSYVKLQMRLVSEAKLRRYQRKVYANMQRRIFNLWDEYEADNLTTIQLLCQCAAVYGPTE